MAGGHLNMRNGIKGHLSRKVENHCSRRCESKEYSVERCCEKGDKNKKGRDEEWPTVSVPPGTEIVLPLTEEVIFLYPGV